MIRHPIRDLAAAALAGAYVEHRHQRTHRAGRRARRHPIAFLALLGSALILANLVLVAAASLLHWGLFLVLPAAAALVAYRVGRRGAVPARAGQGAVLSSCRHCAAEQHDLCNGIGPCACPHRLPAVRGTIQPLQLKQGPGQLAAQLDQLRAERDDLRRQVEKLERDAAEHDDIVSELERAAGRPIEAVLASYRKIAGLYATGARP